MYAKIMVPVDLGNTAKLEKALGVAKRLAGAFDAEVYLVGVTSSAPTPIAHTPQEFTQKLEAYAGEQSRMLGVACAAHTKISHDPAVDLDSDLAAAAEEIGADLVVMASHVPDFRDRIINSNAGALASHASLSVFVVR